MDSPKLLGKRGRIRQLQYTSARAQFEALLPSDTSPDILDALAEELPLHFFALSWITRGNKKLQVFASGIYKISEQYYEPGPNQNENNNNNTSPEKSNSIKKIENQKKIDKMVEEKPVSAG